MLQLISATGQQTVDALAFLLAFALTALMDSVFTTSSPRPWPCLRRQRRAFQGQGPGFRTHLCALHRAGDAGGGAF